MNPHMYFQIPIIRKWFLTNLTRKRLFTGMSALVKLKTCHLSELSTAETTGVRFKTSVDSHMDFQGCVRCEIFFTHLTWVRFLTGMLPLMYSEVAFARKLFITNITAVRFDSCVNNIDMSFQMSPLRESSATDITDIRFLSGVSIHVGLQCLIVTEGLVTYSTTIFPLTGMSFHMFF